MVYLTYIVLISLFSIIYNPEIPKNLYLVFKVDRKYIAGLFASLGISALANKIDYILYWNLKMIIKWKFSILFAIIMILISLWLFDEKEQKDL